MSDLMFRSPSFKMCFCSFILHFSGTQMYTTIQKLLILFIFLEEASYVSHVFDLYIITI